VCAHQPASGFHGDAEQASPANAVHGGAAAVAAVAQEVGVRGAAILALQHKAELARQHGIKLLVDHMNNPLTEEIKTMALKAILNLSLSQRNQVCL
jgi:uncharacterized UPF0146 family protein